jgi:hypothetical protein
MDLVCSFCITSSGGKDNSSGGSVPRSRIACHSTRRKIARGVATTLNSAPTRCGGILEDTPACSPVPHMMDWARMPQQPNVNTEVLDAHHMQPCFKLRSDVVAVPNPMMAFFTRWELPLGLQSTDPRSTAVGAEPCSTPVFNLFSM